MKGFIRFMRAAALGGIVLLVLGLGMLLVGPDRLVELATDPPPWLAVSAIVFVTFAGAMVVAFFSREKPAAASEPYKFSGYLPPAKARERAASTRDQVPKGYNAAPAQLRLPEARPHVIVPPPPPMESRRDPPHVRPVARVHNQTPTLRVVPSLVLRAAVTVARVLRAEARLAWRDLADAQRCVERALRAARGQVRRDARATWRAASRVSRAACRVIARGSGIAGPAVVRGARFAGRAVVRGARSTGWVARVAGGTVTGMAIMAARAAEHRVRTGTQAVVYAAAALDHALLHRVAAVSRAGAGGVRLVGHAAAQTTRSASAASRGGGRQAGSASQVPFAAGAVDGDRSNWRSSEPQRWRDVARQVHDEHGGDLLLLLQVALRIESKHGEFADEVRAPVRRARYAAGALYALPLAVVVVAAVLDPGYLSRLAANAISGQVAMAALLTAVGAWWSHRLLHPPFTVRPSVRRALRREAALNQRVEAVLERAALYAAAGLEGRDAVREAARSDPDGPTALLTQALLGGQSDVGGGDADTPLLRCSRTLVRRFDEGLPAVDALVLSADWLRHDSHLEKWNAVLRPALALPLFICLVPAALLLALL